MPELPEVETVRSILEREIVGSAICGVRTDPAFPAVLQLPEELSDPSLLDGAIIQAIKRRGKYLIVQTDTPWRLIVHLRMTGRLLTVPADAPPVRFEHLAIRLSDGRELRFADQRKFGRVMVTDQQGVVELDRRLGIEPLGRSFTARWLEDRLCRRTGPIKAVLLDQSLIAGLGNIYVDESLFRARIHPLTQANQLEQADCARLARSIRASLRLGILNRGTSFATFENPYGESGSNQRALLVYGKGKTDSPCPNCGGPLVFIRAGGRGTTVCPVCQPLR